MMIFARDVQNIVGYKPRQCQLLLQKVRDFFGKSKKDLVTINEFCKYMNLDETEVREYLK